MRLAANFIPESGADLGASVKAGGGGEADDSVREGGGAMAAPPPTKQK